MRIQQAFVPRVVGVALLSVVGLLGMAPDASAQTVCSEAPFLAAVDSNGDGVASLDEIRAVAPDNAELQSAADALAGAGYSGIQYQGCGSSGGDGGSTGGDGGSTGGDGGTTGGGEGVTGGSEGAGTDQTGGEGTTQTGGDGTGQTGTTGDAAEGAEGITEQEQAYIDAVLADMGEMVEIATSIEELFTQVETDATLLEDEEWNTEVDTLLADWKQIAADAETLEPSERQQQIHAVWLSITSLVDLGVDDIIAGMEQQDQDVLTRATDRLNYMTLLLEDLGGGLLAFEDDPNAGFEYQYAIYPVDDCSAFLDYELAQVYYAAWPEDQPTIDPDVDGLACEVFFGVEES